jgi:hypothetical protein
MRNAPLCRRQESRIPGPWANVLSATICSQL